MLKIGILADRDEDREAIAHAIELLTAREGFENSFSEIRAVEIVIDETDWVCAEWKNDNGSQKRDTLSGK